MLYPVIESPPARHPEATQQAAAGVLVGEARVVDGVPAAAVASLPQGSVKDAVDALRRPLKFQRTHVVCSGKKICERRSSPSRKNKVYILLFIWLLNVVA